MGNNKKENEEKFLKGIDNENQDGKVVVGKTHETIGKIGGYWEFDLSRLKDRRLYPQDIKIEYRGAYSPEIRHWSTLDENSPNDVWVHFSDIGKSCVRCTGIDWEDIKEVDRLDIVLAIQEVSVPYPEKAKQIACKCEYVSCKHEFTSTLNASDVSVIVNQPERFEQLSKFINTETGNHEITLKGHEFPIMTATPSLGTTNSVRAWLSTLKPEEQYEHKLFWETIAPHLFVNYKVQDQVKAVQSLFLEYMSWNSEELRDILAVIDAISLVPQTNVNVACPKCNKKTKHALVFKEGVRAVFCGVSNIFD